MPLSTGQVLENRYRIEALLGQGGMGAVYRATDLRLGIAVALKENLQVTPEAERQFGREARILAALHHPNLPHVSDHFSVPGQGQYLVMDFVEGQDLGQIMARPGAIPETQALGWIDQVLLALEYLHSKGLIHRDVKPANVKITPDGQVFLVDFGLAKTSDPSHSTTIGARGVSPGFAPPEQYGMGRTDARSDLYSAGATLYALLTRRKPPDSLEIVTRQAQLLAPRQLDGAISPRSEAAILRAMQIAPADRFQSAAEFRAALPTGETTKPNRAWGAAQEAGSTTVPRRRAAGDRKEKPPRRLWPVVGGAAALLAVVAIGLALLDGCRPEPGAAATATSLALTEVAAGEPTEEAASVPAATEPALISPVGGATVVSGLTPAPGGASGPEEPAATAPVTPTVEMPTPVVVTPTAAVTATATVTGCMEYTYTVQAGDTLYSIAVRYGATISSIVAANGLSDPIAIVVGQVLKIPTCSQVTPGSGACRYYHTVRAGEWIWQISRDYGVDPYAILQANGLTIETGSNIVGQRLCIP